MTFNAIPFNVVDFPYYHGMIKNIAEAGPRVHSPTPYEISHGYLNMEVEDCLGFLKTFHNFWDEYGCTIMCDRWLTQNRRSLINFLVYSPIRTIFLKSVDASDQFKSGEYIRGLMEEVINEVGEHRVVHVVTDNGPNYKGARKLLMQRRHLY